MNSKIDSRKLPDDVREEMRREIIRLRSARKTNVVAADAVGVSYRHANMVWKEYLQSEDLPLFVWERRGRRNGEQRSITREQELELLRLLCHDPAKMKLGASLWTRQLFQVIIKRKLKMVVPIRTLGEYMNRWGLIPKRPIEQCCHNQSAESLGWLCDYQQIVDRARKEGADIQWFVVKNLGGNTASIYDDMLSMMKINVARMFAAIANKGQIRFVLDDGNAASESMIEFMSRLIRDTGRKVFLLAKPVQGMDHDSVKAWLAENASKIELIYLPPFL